MHRSTKSECGELASPRSSRAASFSSEKSPVSASLLLMPTQVSPPAAYVAVAAASQIVSDHHNAQLRDQFGLGNGPPAAEEAVALFSEEGLNLVNAFLDSVLYSILAVARSSSIHAIRPAVVDILKPKLAREAIAQAEQELSDLLAGDEEEDQAEVFDAENKDGSGKWDLGLVWKRTRLRLMVYTRLGEMEDEDEEHYIKQLDHDLPAEPGSLARSAQAGLVSWSSAIFLTSIIEYVAEQVLVVSGQTAFARALGRKSRGSQGTQNGDEGLLNGERVIVGESDVEKVALNSTLGRLWRTWRKRTRQPGSPSSRGSFSRTDLASFMHSKSFDRGSLLSTEDISRTQPDIPEMEPTETDIAANIPLPMSDNDVAEIEVPGLAKQFDEDSTGTQTPIAPATQRPASMLLLSAPHLLLDPPRKSRPSSLPPRERAPFAASETSASAEAPRPVHEAQQVDENEAIEGASAQEHEPKTALEEKPAVEVHQEKGEDVEADAVPLTTPAAATVAAAEPEVESAKKAEIQDIEENAVLEEVAEAKVLNSRHLSIEVPPKPPQIVRTNSRRSPRTPRAGTPQSIQHKSSEHSPVAEEPSNDIGLAKTSDRSVAQSPPVESESKSPSTGNGEQVTMDLSTLDGSAVDSGKSSPYFTPPQASFSRKSPSPDYKTGSPVHTQREDAASNRSHPSSIKNVVLPPVQESGGYAAPVQEYRTSSSTTRSKSKDGTTSSPDRKKQANTGSTSGSSKTQSPKTADSGDAARAKYGSSDAQRERAQLQRVSSGSDARSNYSVNTSILHSARASDSSISRPRGLSGRMSEEDREREFDSLVRGEETVKYTLTPQSMRDIDSVEGSGSGSGSVVVKKEAAKPPTKGPAPAPVQSTPVRSTSIRNKSSQQTPDPTLTSARPPPTNTTPRKHGPSAREPRVQTESLRDFADFIRSTGPQNGQGDVRPISTTNSTHSKLSGLGRKTSVRSNGTMNSTQPREDGPTARPRLHLEPRSPANHGGSSSDLIDFIRQGPQGHSSGEHRIARTVAPFRTTMDSDEFNHLFSDRSPDGTPIDTSFNPSHSNPSTARTSANSRTGLLPSTTSVAQPAYSNGPQHLTSSFDEPQITKTRRRIKDPYALDDSDEDEDFLTALPKSKPRQEESLMDFLRSAPPPSNAGPLPLNLSSATVNAARARNAAFNNKEANGGQTNDPHAVKRNAAPLPPLNDVGKTVSSGTPKQKYAPRAARDARADREAAYRNTNDLADFLRTSGPPEPPVKSPFTPATPSRKPSFWRRRKNQTDSS